MRGTAATISQLWIYPVKSMGGTPVVQCDLSDRGLVDDRRWMVVDTEGNFITQRTHPRMALIAVHAGPDALVLEARGMERLTLPRTDVEPRLRTVRVFDSVCEGQNMCGPASEWLEAFLQIRASLVYMPDASHRHVGKYAKPEDIVSFADGFPLLVATEASLAELNARLEQPVSMRRFRPNVVVSGTVAWDEDHWQHVTLGSVPMRPAKPCGRCVIVNIDPTTAISGKEPLRTLARYRRQGTRIVFGQNLIHDETGTLRVGDPVNAR